MCVCVCVCIYIYIYIYWLPAHPAVGPPPTLQLTLQGMSWVCAPMQHETFLGQLRYSQLLERSVLRM